MKTDKTKKKEISLLEFRAWLNGVEELQPRTWAPSPEQWKMIRKKIDQISTGGDKLPITTTMLTGPAYKRPSGPNVIPPAPPVAGGVPAGQIVDNPIITDIVKSGSSFE